MTLFSCQFISTSSLQVVGPFIDKASLLFGDYAPVIMVSSTNLACYVSLL